MKTTNPGILKHLFWLWILSALLLSACGNRFEDQLRENYKIVQTNLQYLKNQLDTKQLSNALLIEKYANALIRQKPDYSNIANLMKKEATSQGKAYTALSKRLAAVNLSPTNTEQASASLQELQLINSAADIFEFNNSLADVVNTLASLSDGKLPLINVPASQKASAQQANALIGNPSYGSWRQDNSGRSFWEWYGMYSLFNNVFGRHTYYNSWSSRPHYSYYNNYGRNRWGSSADINRNHNLSRRYPSRYNKPSAAARTRYARGSSRSSSYGGGYNKSSSSRYSAYGSSSRSSSFTSSRGFRGGK
ncbi:hypothetical protein MNBD_GAMMA24-1636 [hydrothermal vent metagenome]|uniref:Lipoprotein n=1 Tax=hydrothermal vent metagenome TaxID=652676 RepID=A0A3B1BSG8_9ZZZZ